MAKPKAKPTLALKSSSGKPLFSCPHCGKQYDFPSNYCKICKDHRHVLFMGDARDQAIHPNICNDCWKGVTTCGQKWHREQRTWKPDPFFASSWDWPEWYDVMEEWKCSTIQNAWNENADNLDEL